jgi:hypothetical protein
MTLKPLDAKTEMEALVNTGEVSDELRHGLADCHSRVQNKACSGSIRPSVISPS